MSRIKSAFELEIFDSRNASSERLASFLTIYVKHFGVEHRTSTNELLDFLARPPPDRKIVYFGLSYDNRPCGFATFMHYPAGPIGIVDHLVLSPTARGYGAFFNFCDLIARYLEKREINFDHILAEVMLSETQVAATLKPLIILRLIRMVGFRVARIPYWAPDPAIVKDVDACRAALLFASQPERDELSADEFKRIVSIVYKIHYAKWYERSMDAETFKSYKDANDRVLKNITKASDSSKRIKLNGMKNIDQAFVIEPYPRVDLGTYIYICLIVVPAVVGVVVAFAEERFISAVATIIVIAILVIFSCNARLKRYLLRLFRLAE